MASSSARRIKLSVNLKPFVSRVVRDGRRQKEFAQTYGRTVGGCVRSSVKKGMSGAEIHDAVRRCAKGQAKGA